IVVVVEKTGAGTPSSAPDARLRGYIGKGSVAIIVIQGISAVAGYIDILEAVIVVVADRHSHAVEVLGHSAEPGFPGNIAESAIRILVVQTIPEFRIRFVRHLAVGHGIVNASAVDKEEVQPSIVVIVQQSDPAPHGLDQVLVSGR